ncbi:MAG: hypothetical protein JW996_04365 [Candidatus Cloacimonetes bacterium]|nr:hypothetical protein [Candidatus Cloacimonadota bacterium]
MKRVMLLIVLGLMFVGSQLIADEISDLIEAGLKNYKDGDYSQAIENLSYANQLIKQKKGENLEVLLPAPLSGWEADDATSSAAADALFGGGITVSRDYYKEDSNINITIMSDSPMMQSMMMIMSNPMFATSDGGKIETINGQKAIVKFEASGRSGDVNIIVNGKYMITVQGNNITKNDLVDYAKAIDYNKIAALQ